MTLLFSNEAYKKVLEAYITGLEDRLARGESVKEIASVASFFVSRIDVKIDREIDRRVAAGDKDADRLKALRGKVAIANAKMAYEYWKEITASARWKKLADAGASPSACCGPAPAQRTRPSVMWCTWTADRSRDGQHHPARNFRCLS